MLKLEVPFSLVCAGSTKSGKTRFLLELLKTDGIFQKPIDDLIICYGQYQPIYEDMADQFPGHVEMMNSVPWEQLKSLTGERQTLVVIDDMMQSEG